MTNRKLHTRFQWVPKSTTLDDAEGPFRTLLQNTCVFRGPSGKFNKDSTAFLFYHATINESSMGSIFWTENLQHLWNGARWDQGYYWWPIGSCIRTFNWCQNQQPWMTLKDHYALWFKTHASFGAHQENLNKDSMAFLFYHATINESSISSGAFMTEMRNNHPCRSSGSIWFLKFNMFGSASAVYSVCHF